MNRSIEYGLTSTATDEKALTAKMKSFFEPLNRVMVKTKSKGLLEARLPYVELYPNVDEEGKRKFDNPEIGWVLFANMKDVHPPYQVPLEEQQRYVKELLEAGGFPYITLREYADDEERL
ncbi:hypothetical protein [Saccharibacillus endophyticus]|uniref:Uncharacterized protein n=1 Tax=Saccharibacillus endophyticus TaxID=2060666 RepID=A0ABQ1ZX16_9BACL|nr:hypothetical protein [Saccharibacillus endophyticus]GGH79795.1 hypothetical protein GCM10007362_27130 [Saccharibacillus endophyticus]